MPKPYHQSVKAGYKPCKVYTELEQRLRKEHKENQLELSKIHVTLDNTQLPSQELLARQDHLIWRNHDIVKILES